MRKLSNEKLQTILKKHNKWLNDEKGGEKADLRSANLRHANLRYANLRFADLRFADLRSANLRYANLRYANLESTDLRFADLRYANLESADLDFSCLPLWCGGLDFKIDEKQAKQIMYHLMNLMECSEIELNDYFTKKAFEFVNSSHLVSKHGLDVFEVSKEASNRFIAYFKGKGLLKKDRAD